MWLPIDLRAALIPAAIIASLQAAAAAGPESPTGMAGPVVEVSRTGGRIGGGVQVRPGLIVTAAHVVGRDGRVTVVDDLGRSRTGSVLAAFRNADVAFIAIESADEDIASSRLSCQLPPVGLPVHMVGHPYGRLFVRTEGGIASPPIPVGRWTRLVILNRNAFPGMSGGPVIDADGLVVGIVVAATGPARNGFGPAGAVPADLICGLLARL